MSLPATLVPAPPEELGIAVLAHLADQLASSRRLLDAVLRQGVATRRQDVEGVLACITEIQGEMDRRGKLETERAHLLIRAAGMLGRHAHEISLDALVSLMSPEEATTARERSAELRGLLAEIQREHVVNRALMRQELAFLDHLVRLVGAEEEPGYRPGDMGVGGRGPSQTLPSRHRVLDLEA
jgi:hypothetical protein